VLILDKLQPNVGIILNSYVTKTKKQNKTKKTLKCEKHDTKQTIKRITLYSIKAEMRKQSIPLFDLSWSIHFG
jgi:hypothetical protein